MTMSLKKTNKCMWTLIWPTTTFEFISLLRLKCTCVICRPKYWILIKFLICRNSKHFRFLSVKNFYGDTTKLCKCWYFSNFNLLKLNVDELRYLDMDNGYADMALSFCYTFKIIAWDSVKFLRLFMALHYFYFYRYFLTSFPIFPMSSQCFFYFF